MDIMRHVEDHHKKVKDKFGYDVVMTSLVGSQNYDLATKYSDYDTFSLIMPPFTDLAFANAPISGEFSVEDGKCMYKDIRLALNLLKKTSPNSIEIFLSDYIIFNPSYSEITDNYLKYIAHLEYMIHCNYYHMIDSCIGMVSQLAKRNMPSGKKLAHAIRLKNMLPYYLDNIEVKDLLKIYDESDLLLAQKVKTIDNQNFDDLCFKIADYLKLVGKTFKKTERHETIEKRGLAYIEQFQIDLLNRYLDLGAI